MGVPKDETEEQKAIRLAKAKKNASKAREEAMVAKYKDKVLAKEKEEKKKQVKDESESEDEDEETPKKPLKPVKPIKEEVTEEVNEEVKEEEEKPKPKPKPKTKAKAKVIIEQDSSDDEVFEASKDVIFVKRVRAKKIEQQHAPQSEAPMPSGTAPVTRQEQPLPNRLQQQQAPPPKPPMSQEKRLEMERYLNMTRGIFLPMSRPR